MNNLVKHKTIASLHIGETGIVSGFTDELMSLKLLEMGCLPGSKIELDSIAPLGCPICINVSGYRLAIRLEEAATVLLV
ncbi:MAG: ferrous iron transport protein [Bacteroidota bacterium]|jgi:ferrous iron transport protein A